MDEKGKPIGEVYVFYVHTTPPKLFFPPSYYRSGLTRIGSDGLFSIPLKFHFRFPFTYLISPVNLHLSFYVPRLRNYCTFNEASQTFPYASYCMKMVSKSPEPTRLLYDLNSSPKGWYRTLWLMIYAAPILDAKGPKNEKMKLLSIIRKEYNFFVSEYADVIRDYSRGDRAWMPEDDWIKWDGQKKLWAFFLSIPWYGKTLEQKLSFMENRLAQPPLQ